MSDDFSKEKECSQEKQDESLTFWNWLRQTARLWGFLAFVLFVAVIFRSVALPFILALLVTYVLAPIVRWLGKIKVGGRKVPRFVLVIAVYLVLLSLIGLFFTAFVPRLRHDLKRIVKEAPGIWHKVNENWVPAVARYIGDNFGGPFETKKGKGEILEEQGPPRLKFRKLPDGQLELDVSDLRMDMVEEEKGRWVLHAPVKKRDVEKTVHLEEAIHKHFEELVRTSGTRAQGLLKAGQKLVAGLLAAITTFILVLMISAFLLVDTDRILAWFRNLIPDKFHGDFDNVVKLIDKGLSGAIRGQLLICLINGVLTWIGLNLFGIKYPFLLALLAGVMSLIPIFGSILSSIPIIVVALVSSAEGVDLLKGVLILAWIIGIHLLEANALNPKIIGTAAKIHPVIVIFSVVAGQQTYGAIGALLAVPLVSAVQAVFTYLRGKMRGELQNEAASKP
ncbi:MAG: AI-2E family transporter [Pseudomonadota bacterium]